MQRAVLGALALGLVAVGLSSGCEPVFRGRRPDVQTYQYNFNGNGGYGAYSAPQYDRPRFAVEVYVRDLRTGQLFRAMVNESSFYSGPEQAVYGGGYGGASNGNGYCPTCPPR
jgi:hypothetical protein